MRGGMVRVKERFDVALPATPCRPARDCKPRIHGLLDPKPLSFGAISYLVATARMVALGRSRTRPCPQQHDRSLVKRLGPRLVEEFGRFQMVRGRLI